MLTADDVETATECVVEALRPAVDADWGLSDPVLSERDRTNPGRDDLPAGRRPHAALRTT